MLSVAALLGGCGQTEPTYAHLPPPGSATRPILAPAPEPDPVPPASSNTTRSPVGPAAVLPAARTGFGACGRLQALRAYRTSLLDLIAAIEADGVTPAERTDLLQAMARLHGAEADMATAAADVAGARYRLQALTGGTLAADDLPPCP